MPKKKIESIRIERVEGLITECVSVEAMNFSMANLILLIWAKTAPKSGGYHKVDFAITYEDGEQYKGRYDMKHSSIEIPDLRKHVLEFVNFMRGAAKPAHMKQDVYDTYISEFAEAKDQAIDFYNNYEI